jgi:hypothetical protein
MRDNPDNLFLANVKLHCNYFWQNPRIMQAEHGLLLSYLQIKYLLSISTESCLLTCTHPFNELIADCLAISRHREGSGI